MWRWRPPKLPAGQPLWPTFSRLSRKRTGSVRNRPSGPVSFRVSASDDDRPHRHRPWPRPRSTTTTDPNAPRPRHTVDPNTTTTTTSPPGPVPIPVAVLLLRLSNAMAGPGRRRGSVGVWRRARPGRPAPRRSRHFRTEDDPGRRSAGRHDHCDPRLSRATAAGSRSPTTTAGRRGTSISTTTSMEATTGTAWGSDRISWWVPASWRAKSSDGSATRGTPSRRRLISTSSFTRAAGWRSTLWPACAGLSAACRLRLSSSDHLSFSGPYIDDDGLTAEPMFGLAGLARSAEFVRLMGRGCVPSRPKPPTLDAVSWISAISRVVIPVWTPTTSSEIIGQIIDEARTVRPKAAPRHRSRSARRPPSWSGFRTRKPTKMRWLSSRTR